MQKNKVILLLSGGVDSTVLLAKLKKEGNDVLAVSFFYDQKHAIELECAKLNSKKYGVLEHKIISIDLQLFADSALVNKEKNIETYKDDELPVGMESSYVPFRNLIFLSQALSIAESQKIKEVFIGTNRDDSINFWDCEVDFISKLNSISQNKDIKISAPLINLSKTEVIQLARKLEVNLKETISCYSPYNDKECGFCLSCRVKKRALKNIDK